MPPRNLRRDHQSQVGRRAMTALVRTALKRVGCRKDFGRHVQRAQVFGQVQWRFAEQEDVERRPGLLRADRLGRRHRKRRIACVASHHRGKSLAHRLLLLSCRTVA